MTPRRPGYDIDGQPTKVDPRDFPDPLQIDPDGEPRWLRPTPAELGSMSDAEFAVFVRASGAQAEAEAALAEWRARRTGYRRTGCSIFAIAAAFLALVAGCSAQPAGNATPSAAPDSGTSPAIPAIVSQGQRGAPQAGDTTLTTERKVDRGMAESFGGSYGAPLAVTYSGIVNYATPSHGRFYLAIPDGRGVRVEICGPAGCLIRTSTDAGPALALQRAGRIADLNSVDWAAIAGVPLRRGGFQGTILIVKRPPRIELPQTDSLEEGP